MVSIRARSGVVSPSNAPVFMDVCTSLPRGTGEGARAPSPAMLFVVVAVAEALRVRFRARPWQLRLLAVCVLSERRISKGAVRCHM